MESFCIFSNFLDKSKRLADKLKKALEYIILYFKKYCVHLQYDFNIKL